MSTLLVITPDPTMPAFVQAAVPATWAIVYAGDGISGIDLVQQLRDRLRLVVLDTAIADLDTRTVCLRIRDYAPALAILPLTNDLQQAASLTELGCLPPVALPLTRAELFGALQTALSAPPAVQAGAIPDLVLEQSRMIERMARRQRSRPVIVVHGAAPLHRIGVTKLLESVAEVHLTLHPSGLRLLLSHLHCTAIIAAGAAYDVVAPIAASFGVPLLLLAESIAQARAYHRQGIAGVIYASDPAMPQQLEIALAAFAAGVTPVSLPPSEHAGAVRSLTPAEVARHFAAAGLSAREIDILWLIHQGLSVTQIAEALAIVPATVTSHWKRIRRKLGGDRAAIQEWIAAQLRERSVGDSRRHDGFRAP